MLTNLLVYHLFKNTMTSFFRKLWRLVVLTQMVDIASQKSEVLRNKPIFRIGMVESISKFSFLISNEKFPFESNVAVIAVDGNSSDVPLQLIQSSLQRTNEELERKALAVQLAATIIDVKALNSFEIAQSRAFRASVCSSNL